MDCFSYYTVSYTVELLAFIDNNKGSLLTCIQDTADAAVSVVDLNNSLGSVAAEVKWWCLTDAQLGYSDGQDKILKTA
jgi:hypothetical protein